MTTISARLVHDARDLVSWESVDVWVREWTMVTVIRAPGSALAPSSYRIPNVPRREDANAHRLGAPRSSDLFQGSRSRPKQGRWRSAPRLEAPTSSLSSPQDINTTQRDVYRVPFEGGRRSHRGAVHTLSHVCRSSVNPPSKRSSKVSVTLGNRERDGM